MHIQDVRIEIDVEYFKRLSWNRLRCEINNIISHIGNCPNILVMIRYQINVYIFYQLYLKFRKRYRQKEFEQISLSNKNTRLNIFIA